VGIARAALNKKSSSQQQQEQGDNEDGTTENPTADLRSHAVGLEMNTAAPSSSSSPPKPSGAAAHTHTHGGGGHDHHDDDEEEQQLPPRRTAVPTHGSGGENLVKASQRFLYFFYFCGTIFASIILWQIIAQHKERHVVAWCVAAIFVGIAVPFSLNDIYMHTLHVSIIDTDTHTHIYI
jgi:hypothetical protein